MNKENSIKDIESDGNISGVYHTDSLARNLERYILLSEWHETTLKQAEARAFRATSHIHFPDERNEMESVDFSAIHLRAASDITPAGGGNLKLETKMEEVD